MKFQTLEEKKNFKISDKYVICVLQRLKTIIFIMEIFWKIEAQCCVWNVKNCFFCFLPIIYNDYLIDLRIDKQLKKVGNLMWQMWDFILFVFIFILFFDVYLFVLFLLWFFFFFCFVYFPFRLKFDLFYLFDFFLLNRIWFDRIIWNALLFAIDEDKAFKFVFYFELWLEKYVFL